MHHAVEEKNADYLRAKYLFEPEDKEETLPPSDSMVHFQFLPKGQLLLRDLLPELGVCEPGHGRIDLELVSKDLPRLPQQPGGHG